MARFTQLAHWVQDSPGWRAMKPGPRALYLELKRRFNGMNNGKLFLSHREAAEALNVNRETAGTYFAELESHGFIIVTQGHCLGPDGKGQSAHYALTEEPLDGKPPTKGFMVQQKQKPRWKNTQPMAGKSDRGGRKTRHSNVQKPENPATFDQRSLSPPLENPAISTSSHIGEELGAVITLADFCERIPATAKAR